MEDHTINETITQLKKQAKKCKSVEELIDLSFSFNYNGTKIKPQQIKNELESFLKITEHLKPKVLVEIGSADGGTLFLFSKILPNDAQIFSIDLPPEESYEGYQGWKESLYQSFATNNQTIHTIRTGSQNQVTRKKLEDLLDGKKIDFLYIDGNHLYDMVKSDFEMFSPLLSEDGVVAFHDISPASINKNDVPRFWNEIKDKHDFIEIIDIEFILNGGFGLLFLNKNSKYVDALKIAYGHQNKKILDLKLLQKEYFKRIVQTREQYENSFVIRMCRILDKLLGKTKRNSIP